MNLPRVKQLAHPLAVLACALVLGGCADSQRDTVQGYVEGEFVYVASPLAGALETLSVQRGGRVNVGDPLFSLECGAETAARAQAAKRLEEGLAKLEDARKGKRPAELDAIEAQLRQAREGFALSEKEAARQTELFRGGAAAAQDLDRARSARDQDRQRVAQLEADLKTAELGARSDQIAAAEANVRALEAALAKAEWDLMQKHQSAPREGLVFDTLYRVGEWIPSGRPVLSLLPPAAVKVRAFVSEKRIGTLHPGEPAQVHVDGMREPFAGKISFISPQAEFTPPVIYSRETRSKLVFMVEVVFDDTTATKLHPGQPVEVQFAR